MRSQRDQPALFLVVPFTVLLWWGTVKTWFMLNTSLPYVPLFLAFFAMAGSFKSISLSVSNLYNYILRREAFSYSEKKGSAYWASSKDLKRAGLHKPDGVFLGCDEKGHPVFFDGEIHGLTLSSAGGGKTVSFSVPTLCHVPLPMVVMDLKGTLACMTKNLRKKHHKQEVFCVNPPHLFTEILGTPACYAPTQILIDSWSDTARHKDLIADAQDMALQLYPDPQARGENQFFRMGSRKLIVFGLIFLVTQRTDNATLSDLLRLLRNVNQLREACYVASCSDVLNGELADMAADILNKLDASDTRQFESFREGSVQALEPFAPSGWLAESTRRCDFRFKDLKDTPATVYLIADPTKMKVFAPWLGLMGWAAITELTRCQNNKPVFFLLDEATNFKIENLSNALIGLREFGIRCWFVIQELEEYARVYGRESLETLLSQTEVKQIFGVQSQKTAELVSRMLGEYTVKSANYNLGHDRYDPIQKSVSEHARRLLAPDEVRRFSEMIVFVKDMPPLHLQKVGYHEVSPWSKPDWVGMNPLFGKKLKGKTRVWLKYPKR